MPPLEKGKALSFTAEGIKKRQVKEENQGDSRHRTQRFVKINAQFVGVDAHIDPRIFAKIRKLMALLS